GRHSTPWKRIRGGRAVVSSRTRKSGKMFPTHVGVHAGPTYYPRNGPGAGGKKVVTGSGGLPARPLRFQGLTAENFLPPIRGIRHAGLHFPSLARPRWRRPARGLSRPARPTVAPPGPPDRATGSQRSARGGPCFRRPRAPGTRRRAG